MFEMYLRKTDICLRQRKMRTGKNFPVNGGICAGSLKMTAYGHFSTNQLKNRVDNTHITHITMQNANTEPYIEIFMTTAALCSKIYIMK